MSAAYTKELLHDLSVNKLPLDVRADLLVTIRNLYSDGVFKPIDVIMLNLYLSGYTINEIVMLLENRTSLDIEYNLNRMIEAIANSSGYTDNLILQRVQMSKQSRARKEKAKEVLERISNDYYAN